MTSIKRCEKEKDDKIGQNDGVEFSSISARDSPRAIAEKRVSQLSLDASEDFAAMEALVVQLMVEAHQCWHLQATWKIQLRMDQLPSK
ncbi:hypothetical protein T459_18866 [Capsicum annuum]|uniref:Uncharacterized protein n=1 Tax=Capsicum annuum TaxID=4072 RepID=A0A2G2Z045_CAPAN|nr:hypothetical protein T459_18866 [Capsicum annuum]